MEERVCPNCGFTLQDDEELCPICGTTVPKSRRPKKMKAAPVRKEEPEQKTETEQKAEPITRQKPKPVQQTVERPQQQSAVEKKTPARQVVFHDDGAVLIYFVLDVIVYAVLCLLQSENISAGIQYIKTSGILSLIGLHSTFVMRSMIKLLVLMILIFLTLTTILMRKTSNLSVYTFFGKLMRIVLVGVMLINVIDEFVVNAYGRTTGQLISMIIFGEMVWLIQIALINDSMDIAAGKKQPSTAAKK